MPPPPSDSDGSLQATLQNLDRRLAELTTQNAELTRKLGFSEQARKDLVAQVEHLIELLAHSRREVRQLQQEQKD
ncbi:MAG: hypothetical protein NXI31_24015 [bacterium]|nr:hypothetical protein [bacterium]